MGSHTYAPTNHKKWLSLSHSPRDKEISAADLNGKENEIRAQRRVTRSSTKEGDKTLLNTDLSNVKIKTQKKRRNRTLSVGKTRNDIATKDVSSAQEGNGKGGSDKADSDEELEIRIGVEYQAEIPDLLPTFSDERFLPAVRDPENVDELLWAPSNKLDPDIGAAYLSFANSRLNCPPDIALNVLYFNNFDPNAALVDLDVPFPPWTSFSKDEEQAFEDAFSVFGKDFDSIKEMLPYRTMQDIISYYYQWKARHNFSLERCLGSS